MTSWLRPAARPPCFVAPGGRSLGLGPTDFIRFGAHSPPGRFSRNPGIGAKAALLCRPGGGLAGEAPRPERSRNQACLVRDGAAGTAALDSPATRLLRDETRRSLRFPGPPLRTGP